MGRRKETENELFWAHVLETKSVTDGLQMLEAEKPCEYLRMAPKVQNILEQRLGKITKANYLLNWKMEHFTFESYKPRTKVFMGPTGIGKTNFALSHLKKSLHITIRQDFEKLGPNKFQYDGIVVDVLPLYRWDAEEVISNLLSSYLHNL